jgi:DNA repair exonuclease SbcCD ATPase subunit
MVDFDQAIVNLERFIGLVVNATSAVGQVEDHVVENGRRFGELEQDAGEGGGGLNDRLEELATTLEAEEAEAVTALGELAQAGTTAQQDVTELDAKVEQAATDLDQAADAVEAGLEQASTQLDHEGFEPWGQAMEAAQQELEASEQEAEQSFTELVTAVGGFASEAEAAWNEVETELDESTTALVEAETALEAEAQEDVQAFDAAADAFEGACGALVTDVDQIYDALDTGVAAQGQEWERTVDAAAQEMLTFVQDAREQRLQTSASMVDDEALGTLNQRYEALGTVLDAAAAPLAELEPLSAELARAQTVVGQIDELMNALS